VHRRDKLGGSFLILGKSFSARNSRLPSGNQT